MIDHLYVNKVPIAVATSSGKDTFKVKTANYQNVFSKFHHIVLGSADPEVKLGKPAPDIFLVCASRFDDKPLPENVRAPFFIAIIYVYLRAVFNCRTTRVF